MSKKYKYNDKLFKGIGGMILDDIDSIVWKYDNDQQIIDVIFRMWGFSEQYKPDFSEYVRECLDLLREICRSILCVIK